MPSNLESNVIEHRQTTWSRRRWLCCTWALTWWIPSFCMQYIGGMKRRDVRNAWREKVAICILIATACFGVLFFIIAFPRLLCPKTELKSVFDVESMNQMDKAHVVAYGRYFDITEIVKTHIGRIGVNEFQMQSVLGQDVSQSFFPAANWDASCPGVVNPGPTWDNLLQRVPEKFWPHNVIDSRTNTPQNYLGFLAKYAKGRIGWTREYLAGITDPTKKIIIMYNNVYDVSAYFQGQSQPGFFDDNMFKIYTNLVGKDATSLMNSLLSQDPVYYRNVLNCMNNLFYIGTIDDRNSFRCQFANYVLLAASIVIVVVIGFKFLAALRSMHAINPENTPKYVMVLIPCYTEGRESLENTLNSIAKTDHDEGQKIAVLICDGNVIGEGNYKPTPDIALDILFGGEEEAEAQKQASRGDLSYLAVAEGRKAHNRGQVYSGVYSHGGQNLPFMVIVKTGTEQEKVKPGNRGKRDTQILMMRFLNKYYTKQPLSELEYEIYRQMNDIIGIDPKQWEYMLMVDADTVISEDSITKLVSCMVSNKKIIGLCGETFVANEKDNVVTMIQVYEYFISHHLAKAFESMFGSVTCLPGCFCMYRIRTQAIGRKEGQVLLISPSLIEEYAEPNVNTLHMKNLLSLGEDRYLTTLILKHFSSYKTMFTPDATCKTNAPDRFGVLMSQRRRWINSTIHNLVELASMGSNLCGFCCASMRFVVLLDLLSTIVAPASVLYVLYLVYSIVFEGTKYPMISLILIGAVYGCQMVIFVLKSKWEHIGWMIIYMLSMPIFSFWLPIYSFWKMDEFRWGNTRMVSDSSTGIEKEIAETEDFDIDTAIVRKSLKQWKAEEESKDEEMNGSGNYFDPTEANNKVYNMMMRDSIITEQPTASPGMMMPPMMSPHMSMPPMMSPHIQMPPMQMPMTNSFASPPIVPYGGINYAASYAPSHPAMSVHPAMSMYAPSQYQPSAWNGSESNYAMSESGDAVKRKQERKERREKRERKLKKKEEKAKREEEEAGPVVPAVVLHEDLNVDEKDI